MGWQLIWILAVAVIQLLATATTTEIIKLEKGKSVKISENEEIFDIKFERASMIALVAKFESDGQNLTSFPIPTGHLKFGNWIKEYDVFLMSGGKVRIFFVAEVNHEQFRIGLMYANDFKPSTITRPFYQSTVTFNHPNYINGITQFDGALIKPINFELIASKFFEKNLLFYQLCFHKECSIVVINLYDVVEKWGSDQGKLDKVKTSWNGTTIDRFWVEEKENRLFVYTAVFPGIICVQRSSPYPTKPSQRVIDDLQNQIFELNPELLSRSQQFKLSDVEWKNDEWPRNILATSNGRPANINEEIWKTLCRDDRVIDENLTRQIQTS